MRVQCGQGHWFDDEVTSTCDHLDAGEPCGYPPLADTADSAAKIRAFLDGDDPVLAVPAPEPDDEVDVEVNPSGPAEARAAAAAAREKKSAAREAERHG